MNSAARAAASILGIYAGLLGMEHGFFETMQGGAAPDGLMINTICPSCQVDEVRHACPPALTIIPNFLITVILAILVGVWRDLDPGDTSRIHLHCVCA